MIILALVLFSLNQVQKQPHRIVESTIIYKYLNEDWESLLDYATHRKDLTQTSVICINYALYKDGHLNSGMFIFDQSYLASGLLPPYGLRKSDHYFRHNFFYNKHAMILSRIYYELGLYAMSYRIASDFIARYGNQPQALLLMLKNCLALNKEDAARSYGSILKQNPLYSKKVDALFEKKGTVNKWQGEELTALSYYPVVNLEQLLDEYHHNDMALQYYIASVLLSKDRARLSKAVDYLNRTGAGEMPKDLEYFILLELFLNDYQINTGNIKLKKERYLRLYDFTANLIQTPSEEAARELLRPFRNDFMYYYILEKGEVMKTKSEFDNSDYLN